jgi:hypothetical protein
MDNLIEFAKEQCEIFPEDSYMGEYLRETLKMLQAEPCEDAVSREDVVERAKIDKAIEEIEEYLLEEEVNGIHEQGIMFALEIFEENGICKRNIGE